MNENGTNGKDKIKYNNDTTSLEALKGSLSESRPQVGGKAWIAYGSIYSVELVTICDHVGKITFYMTLNAETFW